MASVCGLNSILASKLRSELNAILRSFRLSVTETDIFRQVGVRSTCLKSISRTPSNFLKQNKMQSYNKNNTYYKKEFYEKTVRGILKRIINLKFTTLSGNDDYLCTVSIELIKNISASEKVNFIHIHELKISASLSKTRVC